MKESHPLFLWPPWSYPQGAVLMLIGGGGGRVYSEMQGITVYSHTLSLKRDTRPSREMQGFAFLHLLGPLLRMWFGVMGGPMWGRQHRWSVSKPNLGPLSHAPSNQPTDTGLWWRKLQHLLQGIKQGVLVGSVRFSSSVMSDSLGPHGLQHASLPHPSPTPGASSNSCPSSQWCHPTISSSVVPFSSCLQSFPSSGSFPVTQFFASGGQSIGASTSALVLPMNIQDWFPLGLTGLIFLQSKGFSRILSSITVWNYQFFGAQLSLWSNSHIHTWLLEKP